MADPLEQIIRPIVEGQIRSFINDHPEVVEAVDWYKPRPDKKATLVNSVSKRILRDLLCAETRMRLVQALGVIVSAEAEDEDTGVGTGVTDPVATSGVL